jgi:hypothetical protein
MSHMLFAISGAFVFVLSEVHFNIWLMDLPK